MTTLYDVGDSIEGKKIICAGKRIEKPHRVSTSGEHNIQQTKIDGNPARAVIDQPVRWKKN